MSEAADGHSLLTMKLRPMSGEFGFSMYLHWAQGWANAMDAVLMSTAAQS